MSTQFCPLGDRRANWSNVIISPPASKMRARAPAVTLSAQTFSLGTLCIRTSSVIDPTTTAVLPSRPPFFMFWANREMDIGGRLILLMKSLLRTTLLNLALVLLARNLYSFTNSLRYTSSLLGSVLRTLRSFLWLMSIP